MKSFAVCHLSIAPVRITSSDRAEIVTQLLFGESVSIIEIQKPWVKIICHHDNYEGWMDEKQLIYLNQEEFDEYHNKPAKVLNQPLIKIEGPLGVQHIMLGSTLPNYSMQSIKIGSSIYELKETLSKEIPDIKTVAMSYLNTPYLWGGRSIFGIDCSGFIQNIYKILGMKICRDASQQINYGEEVHFSQRKEGDLAFFINDKDLVHHVGLLIEGDKIIHASGAVRIDKFDEIGIHRSDISNYTHKLLCLRRIKILK